MRCFGAIGVAISALAFQPGAGHAQTATICGQKVDYAMTPPAPDIPARARAFSGIWVGQTTQPSGNGTDVTLCIGFVIARIEPQGVVRARYVWGDSVTYHGNGVAIKPGVSKWRGNLAGDVLHFASADGSYRFDLRMTGADELRGVYSTPDGPGDVQLKRQQADALTPAPAAAAAPAGSRDWRRS